MHALLSCVHYQSFFHASRADKIIIGRFFYCNDFQKNVNTYNILAYVSYFN